jgi:hypothetical protein
MKNFFPSGSATLSRGCVWSLAPDLVSSVGCSQPESTRRFCLLPSAFFKSGISKILFNNLIIKVKHNIQK